MSNELKHLQRSRVRLAAWLMQHDWSKDLAGEMVDEALKKVSKACQIVAEKEEYEREQKGGVSDESSVEASKADEEAAEGLVRVL